MLDKKEFTKIRNKLEDYNKQRESLIKKSRDVLRISKQLIYSLHRDDLKSAKKTFKKAKSEKDKMDKIVEKHNELSYEGSYSEANQEFAEALCYYFFITKKRLPEIKELSVSQEDFLLGICDFTGELTRKAVRLASKKKKEQFQEIKDLVEEIYGEFLKFNLRNGRLRKKAGSLKWNLKKLEEINYDMTKNANS